MNTESIGCLSVVNNSNYIIRIIAGTQTNIKSTTAKSDKTIQYGITFNQLPIVICSHYYYDYANVGQYISSVSLSSFVYTAAAGETTTRTIGMKWVAIGY